MNGDALIAGKKECTLQLRALLPTPQQRQILRLPSLLIGT